MVAALFTEVPPARASAVTAANLRASARPVDNPPQHWQAGIAWRSEICPAYATFDACGDGPDVPDSASGLVYYRPVAFRVEDECITRNVGFDIERVTRQAEAVTSAAMAAELWSGATTQANPYDHPDGLGGTVTDDTNAYLAGASAEVISDAVTGIMEGLGLLEERARQAAGGQQVFLHVPNRVTTQLGAQLRRVGNLIYTQTDAVVIGDPGYPGTGPLSGGVPAAGVWAYATGPVFTYLDSIYSTTDPRITTDRSDNRRMVWAERTFGTTFDPCCHFAIQIDAPA
jgi:hypothetical protein